MTEFEIHDRDGWTGVEAETIDAALFACSIIEHEGYAAPFTVYPVDSSVPVASYKADTRRAA